MKRFYLQCSVWLVPPGWDIWWCVASPTENTRGFPTVAPGTADLFSVIKGKALFIYTCTILHSTVNSWNKHRTLFSFCSFFGERNIITVVYKKASLILFPIPVHFLSNKTQPQASMCHEINHICAHKLSNEGRLLTLFSICSFLLFCSCSL